MSSNTPNTAKPGETFEVALTVNKGELKDFAKLQYSIPTGATAVGVDLKGGDFKVLNDMVKITWMGMPSEHSFTVKFKVTTTKETSGAFTMTGKFSYIENGEPKDVFFTQHNITIGSPNTVATTNAPSTPTTVTNTTTNPTTTVATPTTTTTTTTNTNPVVNNTPATASTNTTTTTTAPTTAAVTTKPSTTGVSGKVSATRTLSTSQVANGGSFEVEITVNKSDVTGYAKIQDNLPIGFTATEIESFGGSFSSEDNKAKILWMTIPSAATFKIKYKVTVSANISGKQKITGFFSYLPDQNSDTKIEIPAVEITVGNAPVAATNNTPTTTTPTTATVATKEPATTATTPNTTTTTPNTASTTNTGSENKATNTSTKNQNTTADASTPASVKVIEKEKPVKIKNNTPTSDNTSSAAVSNPGETNSNQVLYYSVQICATKKAVDVSYFQKNNTVSEKIYVQMHEGWHKYTVGEFKVYKEARDHRENVKTNNKIVGPFVTAYNKGTRITVQEALMISGQQWVQ